MSMKQEDFNAIEDSVSYLLNSVLTEEQLKHLNSLIRLTHKHIHKSNYQVSEALLQAQKATKQVAIMELLLKPVNARMQ